jgi:hypothetical protein
MNLDQKVSLRNPFLVIDDQKNMSKIMTESLVTIEATIDLVITALIGTITVVEEIITKAIEVAGITETREITEIEMKRAEM